MENKYYDLIISLIKNHRKYPGLESILDDIANDVLEHSKVVLSTVSNEDVIRAYLEKTVATSIITVPKKKNLNTRIRHRVIESLTVETNVVEVQDEVILKESDLVNIQEESIVELEETFEEEILPEESILLEDEFEDPVVINDNEVIEDSIDEIEILETVHLVEDVVDKTLVDKMINGVSVKESVEEIEETILSEEVNEVYETLEDVEPIEESLDETVEIIEETETLVEEETIDSELPLNIEEPVLAFDINEITMEQDVNVQQETLLEDILCVETDEEIMNLSIDESEDIIEPVSDKDAVSEEGLVEEFSIDNIEQEQIESNNSDVDFQPPSYECFSFEPEKRVYDEDDLSSELNDIDKKHPERKILEICALKYSQKLSVSEIAKLVGFSEEQVIDVLNEIIETVKD